MYPLLLCSVLGLAFIIERLWALLKQPYSEEPLLTQIRVALEQGNPEEAQRACEERPGAISSVALAGLYKRDAPREEMRELMESVGSDQITHLERYLIVLATVAEVSPLLGFLGTVTGMIRAFNAIAQANTMSASIVASGVSEALITTATGLFIAIPVYTAHNYFVSRIDQITAAMERMATHLLEIAKGQGNNGVTE
jgi:biopolymer transport protein ExbB